MYANRRKPYPMPEVEHFHTKPAHNGHFYVIRHFKANSKTGRTTHKDMNTLVTALTELASNGFPIIRVDVFENVAVLNVVNSDRTLLTARLGRTGVGNYKHYSVEQPPHRDYDGSSYIVLTYTPWTPTGLFVSWMRGIAAPRIPWTLAA